MDISLTIIDSRVIRNIREVKELGIGTLIG